MNSRITLVLLFATLMLNTSCSTPDSKANSETAETAAKKDADSIATDTGIEDAASGDAAGNSAAKPGPGGAAGAAQPEKSLFDRIGGKEILTKFADKFVDSLAANPKITSNPKVAEAMKKDLSKQKSSMAEYLCQISGGPCKYNGPSLKDAHKPYGINADQWKVMGGLFIKTLRELNVGKNERKELANLVSMSKYDVIGQ